jgi:hypothetical protein
MKKKGNNSKMGNGIYFKIAGWVDLDMLRAPSNMAAVTKNRTYGKIAGFG